MLRDFLAAKTGPRVHPIAKSVSLAAGLWRWIVGYW